MTTPVRYSDESSRVRVDADAGTPPMAVLDTSTTGSTVRLGDAQMRVVVADEDPQAIVRVEGSGGSTVVVDQPKVRVITVGTQGPAGVPPDLSLPGTQGDVLFNNGPFLGADATNFNYSLAQQALHVRRLTGTNLDGGNF